MTDLFLKHNEIREIFQSQLKIESYSMSINTLFSFRRIRRTKYDPYYQRNYVWDSHKATYFVESILLGTEIPPLVFFSTEKQIEIIDGRQRFETIKRFYVDGDLQLTNKGLYALKKFQRKKFSDLDIEVQDIFKDTKLRIIEFSIINPSLIDERKEDLIKKEIFRRYNSGITPLRSAEIEKAIYITDNLTEYFKTQLKKDKELYGDLLDLFVVERDREKQEKTYVFEDIMKKIRLFMVLNRIPIRYYSSTKRRDVIEKLYENFTETVEDVDEVFKSFIQKVRILKKLKTRCFTEDSSANKLLYECLYWALSILENEKIPCERVLEEKIFTDLVEYFENNFSVFYSENSHFYKDFNARYETTARFFSQAFSINLNLYLTNEGQFSAKELLKSKHGLEKLSEFESLRLNRPDPEVTTIETICELMGKRRFLIRPPYQRFEVINRIKSSAIIESMLLGIKLPPIFVYKRQDGVMEVIDGQQRLLSIVGFLNQEFLDENGNRAKSEKNLYHLTQLRILDHLEGKNFPNLSENLQDEILGFNLSVVNIDAKVNLKFDPIDLFIRLNNRPYPIRENSFEMWNSYVDKTIIAAIKQNVARHSTWFFSRVNNQRMENEELYTTLVYLDYKARQQLNDPIDPSGILDIYQRGERINARIKAKSDLTKVLNQVSSDPKIKNEFSTSVENVEAFVRKVQTIVQDRNWNEGDNPSERWKTELDKLFSQRKKYGTRTYQTFYILWYILYSLSEENISRNRELLRKEITALTKFMKNTELQDSETDGYVTFMGKITRLLNNCK